MSCSGIVHYTGVLSRQFSLQERWLNVQWAVYGSLLFTLSRLLVTTLSMLTTLLGTLSHTVFPTAGVTHPQLLLEDLLLFTAERGQ